MLSELARTPEREISEAAVGRGMLIVVSSPSGGGKGTLIDRVLKSLNNLAYSVSYTTRASRPGEMEGREYFFVSTARFEEMIERGEFLEWANVYGHLYGTSSAQVERERRAGRDIILEIDVQGAANVRATVDDPVTIFILPPSFEVLRDRLIARGTDSQGDLECRLKRAPGEVEQYKDFQYVILNDDVERAANELAAIITAERTRRERTEPKLKSVVVNFESQTGSRGAA
jgi:guanylate kinase